VDRCALWVVQSLQDVLPFRDIRQLSDQGAPESLADEESVELRHFRQGAPVIVEQLHDQLRGGRLPGCELAFQQREVEQRSAVRCRRRSWSDR
jgi:hypothetical protein